MYSKPLNLNLGLVEAVKLVLLSNCGFNVILSLFCQIRFFELEHLSYSPSACVQASEPHSRSRGVQFLLYHPIIHPEVRRNPFTCPIPKVWDKQRQEVQKSKFDKHHMQMSDIDAGYAYPIPKFLEKKNSPCPFSAFLA